MEYYQKALDITLKVFGPEHPNAATSYLGTAGIYFSQGDYIKALEYLQMTLDIGLKVWGPEHPNVIQVKKNIEYTEQLIKTAE